MFKHLHLKKYIVYGVVAAILYCIPVAFYLRDVTWSQSWLLYLGNALFMVMVAVFLLFFNRRRNKNASSMSMVTAGVTVTFLGILFSCLICALLLYIMIPGLFHARPDKILTGEPANSVPDKAHGPVYMVFFSAVMGNISTGFFVCIIFPFTLKGDQTKEKSPSLERPSSDL
jgi:Na+/proline symporter